MESDDRAAASVRARIVQRIRGVEILKAVWRAQDQSGRLPAGATLAYTQNRRLFPFFGPIEDAARVGYSAIRGHKGGLGPRNALNPPLDKGISLDAIHVPNAKFHLPHDTFVRSQFWENDCYYHAAARHRAGSEIQDSDTRQDKPGCLDKQEQRTLTICGARSIRGMCQQSHLNQYRF